MFRAALLSILVTAALSIATPAKPAPGLEVSLSGPASVDSVHDIKLTAVVTNTGSEPVKVLKYGSVLDDELSTHSFIASKDGVNANFTGISLQLDMSQLDDSAFAVIPAGGRVTVDHQVAPLFDFEALGTGIYTFEPVTSFQVMDGDANHNVHLVASAKLSVEVKSDVAKRDLEKRTSVNCNDPGKANLIRASYVEAKQLANVALNYLRQYGRDRLFTAYFGNTDGSRVLQVLQNVANENDPARTLNCVDPTGNCKPGVIAYAYFFGNVFFCPPFFTEVSIARLCSDTSVNSRNVIGGTTLHELTHATSSTRDFSYGCPQNQGLAAQNPNAAINNADNYNCFATQAYVNTVC